MTSFHFGAGAFVTPSARCRQRHPNRRFNAPSNQQEREYASSFQLNYKNGDQDDSELAQSPDTTASTKEQEQEEQDDDAITLIPLAREPILLVSSRPILSEKECNIFINHFQDESTPEGESLLRHVRNEIKKLTSYSRNDDEDCITAMPRFVLYPSRPSTTTSPIYPDGLHYDTTPIMASLTAIVYLSNNDNTGATAFPLANQLNTNARVPTEFVKMAQELLDTGMTHAFDECQSEENLKMIQKLDKLGEQLYDSPDEHHFGIRVLPRPGTLCVFCNLLENSMADPQSIHAGERNDDTKILLTFFQEVPVESFETRQEFEQAAANTRRYLLQRYYGEEL